MTKLNNIIMKSDDISICINCHIPKKIFILSGSFEFIREKSESKTSEKARGENTQCLLLQRAHVYAGAATCEGRSEVDG